MNGPLRAAALRLHRDQRGLIVGFFVRMLVAMALLGLAIEEGGQIVVAQVKAESVARAGAQAGADSYWSTKDAGKAKKAAREAIRAKDPGAKMVAFTVTTDGTATVTVREVAQTLVVKHVSFLEGFGEQRSAQTETHS